MKKFWKIPTFVVLSSLLLFSPMITAYAGDKTPPPDSGKDFVTVSTSTSYDFPESSAEQPGGGITPDATQPMPGSGGTAIAEIGVSYNSISLKGYGQSSITADGLGYWTLCAGVIYLKKNGNNVASASTVCDSGRPGGSNKLRETSLQWGSPYGKTWSDSTYHRVYSETFGGNWEPILYFSVSL